MSMCSMSSTSTHPQPSLALRSAGANTSCRSCAILQATVCGPRAPLALEQQKTRSLTVVFEGRPLHLHTATPSSPTTEDRANSTCTPLCRFVHPCSRPSGLGTDRQSLLLIPQVWYRLLVASPLVELAAHKYKHKGPKVKGKMTRWATWGHFLWCSGARMSNFATARQKS